MTALHDQAPPYCAHRWIPACAGMTGGWVPVFHGNDSEGGGGVAWDNGGDL